MKPQAVVRLNEERTHLELVVDGVVMGSAPLGGAAPKLSRMARAMGLDVIDHPYDLALDEPERMPRAKT